MKKTKNQINLYINILIFIITFLVVALLPNEYNYLPYIGILNLFISIIMIIKYKNNGLLTFLISVLMILNICFSLSMCFNPYRYALNWQINLVILPENIICIKNFVLFNCFLLIGLSPSNKINDKVFNLNQIKNKDNIIISLGFFLLLIYALIFGIDRNAAVGNYISNSNPLYEYSIIILIFSWMYSRNNRIMKTSLILYALVYCGQALLYGDRSSCFPMLMLLFILFWKKEYKIKYIIILGFIGIFAGNSVEILRNVSNFRESNIFNEALNRGLHVNTISYSSYAGTQIIRLSSYTDDNFSNLLLSTKSIVLGNSSKYLLPDIANNHGLINKGGGLISSYTYYWGGYLLTALFGFIIARIISKIYSSSNELSYILRISVILFAIRWYIYYPIALFRTALFIPILLYLICKFVNKLIKNK